MADDGVLAMFRTLCPEFSTISDGDVGDWLDIAATGPSAESFGARWPEAVVWKAAHLLKKYGPTREAGSTDGGGPVTSKSAGSRSISWGAIGYTAKTAQDAWWMSTGYGQAYLAIRGTRADATPFLT